jgi:hypothetical protein
MRGMTQARRKKTMRFSKSGLLAAVAFCALSAAPAFAAQPSWAPPSSAPAWGAGGNPNNPGHSRGAPGPLAGAGLPFLIAAGAAGAYKLIRRRREESRSQRGETDGSDG